MAPDGSEDRPPASGRLPEDGSKSHPPASITGNPNRNSPLARNVRFVGLGVSGGFKFAVSRPKLEILCGADPIEYQVIGCEKDDVDAIVRYAVERFCGAGAKNENDFSLYVVEDFSRSDSEALHACAFGFNDAMARGIFMPRTKESRHLDPIRVEHAHAYFVGYAEGLMRREAITKKSFPDPISRFSSIANRQEGGADGI